MRGIDNKDGCVANIETIREYRRKALAEDAVRAAGEAALVRLANRLYTLRESKRLTQQELADRVGGLDQAAISDIENGDANPTTRTLGRLAAALDVEVSALLDCRPLGIRYGGAVNLHEDVKWQGRQFSTEANRTPATKKVTMKATRAKAFEPDDYEKAGVG